MRHQQVDLGIGKKAEWKGPMATARPGLDIRPGWRYRDEHGALVEVDTIRNMAGCTTPVAEVVYHRLGDGRKRRIYERFARELWRPAPDVAVDDDQRTSRKPSGAVIVYAVVTVVVVVALAVLATWW